MKNIFINVWKWCRDEKRSIWFEYSTLSLIILLPLLLPGYILTLDLVFTPHFVWPAELTNTYPLEALLWLMHFILPGDVIEKIILFLILMLSGVGMHRLLRSIKVKEGISPEVWQTALYFGGLFYMINPFTYSRFMAGQWMVLLGYALLPFFIQAFIRLLALPSRRQAIVTALLAFVITTVSLHHAGMLLIIALLIVIVASILRYWRDGTHVKKFLGWTAASAVFATVLSSFWIIPTILGQNNTGQAVTHFDESHFKAFETTGGNVVGAISQVIRLQGFWVEDRGLYSLPQSMIPIWGLLFLALWAVIIIGVIKAWRKNRMLVSIAVGCIILGIILAATPLVEILSRSIPFIAGYREPQKFVNLIVIGYSILGVFGVGYIIEWASKRFADLGSQVAIAVCLFLPLAITPTMLWGFSGQLTPRAYPTGWSEMNQELKSVAANDRTLFLPWHQYATFDFAGRIIANPAEKYFETPVIISDDPEFKNVSPTIPDEEKRQITEALNDTDTLTNTLRSLHIRYILLSKEKDKIDYGYLNKLDDLTVVKENADLKLYEIKR
ncbi:MAG TPA: DUF6541 family protein [Candidatus Saccharimonadales bacterium]|nr:DUF6541 family protein [Candidatus Saccharimonadales bacterium]